VLFLGRQPGYRFQLQLELALASGSHSAVRASVCVVELWRF
jgi:hypothetical protein